MCQLHSLIPVSIRYLSWKTHWWDKTRIAPLWHCGLAQRTRILDRDTLSLQSIWLPKYSQPQSYRRSLIGSRVFPCCWCFRMSSQGEHLCLFPPPPPPPTTLLLWFCPFQTGSQWARANDSLDWAHYSPSCSNEGISGLSRAQGAALDHCHGQQTEEQWTEASDVLESIQVEEEARRVHFQNNLRPRF